MRMISLTAIAAIALSVSSPVLAGSDMDAASLNALKTYTLSMEKVNAMQAAMEEGKKNSAMTQKMKSVGDDSKTIADMEAKLSAIPEAMAIYRKHGLSAHDVVVMPFVLMDAGMAVMYPSAAPKLADRMSPAQVAFYKQHQAELKKVTWLNGG